MTITSNKTDFDDFPLSPLGSINAVDFYESFLKCEALAKELPNKELGTDPELSFHDLLHEFHSRKEENQILFRATGDANNTLALLWLSKVRKIAQLFVSLNDIPVFRGISQGELEYLSKLSGDIENLPRIAEHLLQLGIVVIYERSLAGMKVDGAVFRLDSGYPVVALSLRYKRLDHFWFTLMHELAHIVLHYDKLGSPILDDLDDIPDDLIEKQANRLAANSLIRRSDWRACQAKYDLTEDSVIEFAVRVGVHPAIVAGRLQRELNSYYIFSNIVNLVDVRTVLLRNE